MKKRMISMAMTAVMALTLVVAAAPAEVHATANSQTTDVTYKHSNAVAGDGYVVSIPSGIKINAANDTTANNANVTITDTEGGAYVGTGSVAVRVASTNVYKLKAAGKADIAYTLKYRTTDTGVLAAALENEADTVNGTKNLAGTLTSTQTTLYGNAVISDVSMASGGAEYKDTLTFHFSYTAS